MPLVLLFSICLLFSIQRGEYSSICLLFSIQIEEYSFICLLFSYTHGNTSSFVCYFMHPGEYSFICLLLSTHPGEHSSICLLFSMHPGEYSFICLFFSIHTREYRSISLLFAIHTGEYTLICSFSYTQRNTASFVYDFHAPRGVQRYLFNIFLAILAKGNMSFCHHLVAIVCHLSSVYFSHFNLRPDRLANMATTCNSCFCLVDF